MRGEICVGFATIFSFTSMMLLIFVHVGQINTSHVPRQIAMAKVNVSGYGDALHDALFNPIQALYTNNASLPLGQALGLRQFYEFGLYTHCGYVEERQGTSGICANKTVASQFRPLDSITSDMLANYSVLTQAVIVDTTFADSSYLGSSSRAAYWMILLGSICAALALILGVAINNFTFFASTTFAIVGSLFLLIGASIWTVIINKAASVNNFIVGQAGNPSPVGIEVSVGNGVFLTWAAFACLMISIVPYMVRYRFMRSISRAAALLAAFATSFLGAQAIPKVTRTGRYLYSDNGSRFYIKGIAYQEQGVVVDSADNDFGEPSSFVDPLAMGDACKRDLPFLTQLGVNTIRVYSVDSSLNHDDCMNALSNAGIYTIIDLSLPLNGSIDRLQPSWSTNIFDQYIRTIDTFSKYDNVLAYNIGNEVVISGNTTASPFVKAAARDTKAYLKSKGSNILIGYAAINGDATFRGDLANYLSCDSSGAGADSTAIDIYGLNDYEWCGASTFQDSYSATTQDFASYNVVAYFSEFGCITSPPRLWTEAVALLSGNMSDVWSGGIAFSYFPASSAQGQFGMVTISTDGSTVTTSDDFDRLQTQYALAAPPNSPAQSSVAASTYGACPATSDSLVTTTTLPPTPNEAACDCLFNALSCHFTPQTTNYTVVLGDLVGSACGLLSQGGGSCADIGGDGTDTPYGRVAACDPIIKLSYVMSEYYEANSRNAQACSFAGNGTVNAAASSSSPATAAASSCISNPTAVFTVSALPSGAPAGSSAQQTGAGSGKPGSGGGGSNNAATSTNAQTLMGLTLVTLTAVVGGVLTVL
ncbi:hypothetical protein BDN72DRAFT_753554 [Pluteus cervinus]|uniref:Uncharacterized protein n=1 Tax=Pluteus cervinus TaxID=181527 RepID=A0ACD3BFZ3_9AGAR|nr:hypothetical protein BDN72DRAFT_753554 [Pluteus cervinus]